MASSLANFATTGKKIVAIGRNYLSHIHELQNPIPTDPFFFLKPTTSYVPSRHHIQVPTNVTCHHEVELGVVIGKRCRDVREEEAMECVGGYALGIDLTARNMQDVVKKKGLPWSAVKGFDTFCPISSFIPSSAIKDPHVLSLWLKVNGAFAQNGTTSDMIFRIPALLAHCSSIMTLEEGDLLLTGTPAGVGPIKPGDVVEAGLEQDGELLATLYHPVEARQGGFAFKA